MTGVSSVTAYKATDGSLHESPAQAVAINLTKLPSASGRTSAISSEAAWVIIKHRHQIIGMLQQLNPEGDYDNDRPPKPARGG